MSYRRTFWENGKTPINADNLNNLEEGVSANAEALSSVSENMSALTEEIGTKAEQTDLETVNNRVTTTQNSLNTVAGEVDALEASVGTMQNNVGTLQTSVSDLRSDVDDLIATSGGGGEVPVGLLYKTDVVDNLLSTATNLPLSANMGKLLQEHITTLKNIRTQNPLDANGNPFPPNAFLDSALSIGYAHGSLMGLGFAMYVPILTIRGYESSTNVRTVQMGTNGTSVKVRYSTSETTWSNWEGINVLNTLTITKVTNEYADIVDGYCRAYTQNGICYLSIFATGKKTYSGWVKIAQLSISPLAQWYAPCVDGTSGNGNNSARIATDGSIYITPRGNNTSSYCFSFAFPYAE